jgi:hypothetical protein
MNKRSDRYRKLMQRTLIRHYAASIGTLVVAVLLASLLTGFLGSLIALSEMAIIMRYQLAPGLVVTKTIVGAAVAMYCVATIASARFIPDINATAKEFVEETIKKENESIMNALGEANA